MKTVLLLPIVLMIQLSAVAQEKTRDELKVLFNDAEFFFAQEAYADALYEYNELYQNGYDQNANINYKIGVCYLNIPGQKDKAISYLQEAVKDVSKKYNESSMRQKSAPIDAYLFLGNAYRVNNNLSEAINAYTKYKELTQTRKEISYADQQILACNVALKFMANPLSVRLTNLGDSVNTISSNFRGVISGDGKTLLYMNELPFYDAIYYSKYTRDGWSAPINVTPQIESEGNQYVTWVSYDGTRMLLTKEDAFNSDIYTSEFRDGRWTKSVPVSGDNINTKYWESHASLSRDGKTMYFTSNRKDGVGDMDIYISKLLPGGTWGKPVNLGSSINTVLNEDSPFITDNDSLLFFSSQGHESMGGYDIFVSRLEASGQWSKPVNLGYPINTTDDDIFYYPWNNDKVGFISRITDNGFGKEDIYAVQASSDRAFHDILAEHIRLQEPQDIAEVPETPGKPVLPEPAQPAGPDEPAEPVAPPAAEPEPETPEEVDIEPVYFAFDSYVVTEDGKKELNKVYSFMSKNPGITIRITGHADAIGPADYNLRLSERRAEAAKSYLTSRGIDPAKIQTVGMGEKEFAAINRNPDGTDNPAGRQLNRRVEYSLTGTDSKPVYIRATPIPEDLKFRK